MEAINVLIADAHFLSRQGLKTLINRREDIEVVGEAASEKELLVKLDRHPGSLLVMDYDQPGSYSLNTLEQVKAKHPDLNILVISADQDKSAIYEAIEKEINGYLTKECGGEEILDAIQATAKGDRFYCSNVLNYILEKSFSKEEDCAPTPLTPREVQIVQFVAQGKIAKEIGAELHLSTHTVYTHRKNIMKKLRLNSTSELIVYAINNGLVPSKADL